MLKKKKTFLKTQKNQYFMTPRLDWDPCVH